MSLRKAAFEDITDVRNFAAQAVRKLRKLPDQDQRLVSVAVTQMELALMALNRAAYNAVQDTLEYVDPYALESLDDRT